LLVVIYIYTNDAWIHKRQVYEISVMFPRHSKLSQYEPQPCQLQLCTVLECLASKLCDPCLTCLQSSVQFSGFRS